MYMLPATYYGDVTAPGHVRSFYFLRHGETENNLRTAVEGGKKQWIAQGSGTDTELARSGEMQARMAGNALASSVITNIRCSPLWRAVQTAQLTGLNSALTKDCDLKERHFGRHEGSFGPVEMFEGNYDDCEDTIVFSRRVSKALEKAEAEGTLMVAHGGVLRVIAALLGVYLQDDDLRNGCALHFSRDGSKWSVKRLVSAVALVSGATGGIGRAIVQDLLSHGYRLSLGARNVEKLREFFGPEDFQLHFAQFEATDPETMKAWVRGAVTKFARIDALVNNAGMGAKQTDNFIEGTREEFYELMDVNCVAPWLLTQLCMSHLAQTGAGRIVNLCSLSGLRVKDSTNFTYNASKHAQMALTDTIRSYGWDRGVRATAICPGWVNTDLSAGSKVKPEEMTQPHDIARIVRSAIECPEHAAISKIAVNCEYEPSF